MANLQIVLHHAVYSLTILELTKLPTYTNMFNFDEGLYNQIIKHFPLFNSKKINEYIRSIFEGIKQIKMDSSEYGLFSLILILSNGKYLYILRVNYN